MHEPINAGTPLRPSGIAALLACGLFTTIGLFAPSLVLPQLARAFTGVSHAELLTELIGTIASFAFAVSAPFAGALVARHGCRRVILPALILFALCGTLPVVLNDLWSILAARIGVGIALAGIFTGSLAGLGALPGEQRMRMFGWFSVVGGAAAIVLFPLVGVLGQFGWRPAFLVNLIGLLVVPMVLAVPRTIGIAVAGQTSRSITSDRSGGLIGPAMAGLLVIAALVGMGMLIGPIYAPLFLAQIGVVDTRLMAVPVTLGSIAAVFASAVYGRLHARLGTEGVFAFTLLTTAAALTVAGISDGMPLFTTAVVVHSAMLAIVAPNVSAAAMTYSPPDKVPQAIGLANGVMFGAQLAFPFIAAWVRALAGLAGLFVASATAMLVAGTIVCLCIVAHRRGRVAPVRAG